MTRTSRTTLAVAFGVAALLALLAYAAARAAADPAGSPRPGDAVTFQTGQSDQEVRDYWTPERMRDAQPPDMTR